MAQSNGTNGYEQANALGALAAAEDLQAESSAIDGTGPRIPDYDEDLEEEFLGPGVGHDDDDEGNGEDYYDEEAEDYYDESEYWDSSGGHEAVVDHSGITSSPEGMPIPQSDTRGRPASRSTGGCVGK